MSGQPGPSPHDAVFRGVLGVPANAASQLRAVLPGALAARLVIPLVVHHGRRPWASPVQLLDLLDLDPDTTSAARRCLPRFEFLLDGRTGVGDQELRVRPLTAP